MLIQKPQDSARVYLVLPQHKFCYNLKHSVVFQQLRETQYVHLTALFPHFPSYYLCIIPERMTTHEDHATSFGTDSLSLDVHVQYSSACMSAEHAYTMHMRAARLINRVGGDKSCHMLGHVIKVDHQPDIAEDQIWKFGS